MRLAGKDFPCQARQQGGSREGKTGTTRPLPILLHSIRCDLDHKMARFGPKPSPRPRQLMHSGMYGMYALQESVRQMRGTAPAQIPGAKIWVCPGGGGMFAASGTIMMSNEAA